MDAARLLPILGAFLFLLPMLWSPMPGEQTGRSTAADGLYLFLAWAILIVLAALLGSRLVSIEQEKRRPGSNPETDDAGD
ncbi:hypothetical protein L0V05_11890 [Tabrizicola sp. J26]|uniref:hypothetical protein n=1 Tax=Alitabrizicola rongguiensis TaxID=2909234 RepID=UPI001F368887|nr:hypothetical protein [Tabrizicola rongguiensis]MCF1709517.1 hypothetical protein [Tabrizicola rongguiensis]